MARQIENEVKYYYDSHPTEEDLMGETSFHADLVRYLMDVLTWLFHGRLCAIYDNLNFYQTNNPREYPLAPDIAIIPGIAHRHMRSWRVGKSGPAPQVVFEIASEETWQKDLDEKPLRYAHMGVQEYFAYDPNEPPLPRSANRRLFGWQLDPNERRMKEMQPRSDGSIWSPSLESRLVPDAIWLRLYDSTDQLRLTGAEFADQQAKLAKQQAEFAKQQAQFADQRASTAEEQAEIEAQRARAAMQQARAYAEKLRSLGVDPDQILPDQLL